jgi:hypothetical protein
MRQPCYQNLGKCHIDNQTETGGECTTYTKHTRRICSETESGTLTNENSNSDNDLLPEEKEMIHASIFTLHLLDGPTLKATGTTGLCPTTLAHAQSNRYHGTLSHNPRACPSRLFFRHHHQPRSPGPADPGSCRQLVTSKPVSNNGCWMAWWWPLLLCSIASLSKCSLLCFLNHFRDSREH